MRSDVPVTLKDFQWVQTLVREYGCDMQFSLADESVIEPGNARVMGDRVDVRGRM